MTALLATPDEPNPRDQAWFWNPDWLAGERQASAQIAAGNLPVYDDIAAVLAALDIA